MSYTNDDYERMRQETYMLQRQRYEDKTTEELYNDIIDWARSAQDFELNEQDHYACHIRMLIDEIDIRIREAICGTDE